MIRWLRSLCFTALLATLGCSTNIGRYGESRALDFLDIVPVSVAGGLGAMAQVRATPFVGLGLGYANVVRLGSDEQRFGPIWTEKERGIPVIVYYRVQTYEDRKRRFSGGDPIWWDETYRSRGNSWIILPGFPRDGEYLVPLPGPFDPPERHLWTIDPWLPYVPPYAIRAPWHFPDWAWWNFLNVEAGVVAGPVGVRVGISPIQALDFVLGIFLVDFVLDDPRTFPILWPDPDAAPSFPDAPANPTPANPAPANTPPAKH